MLIADSGFNFIGKILTNIHCPALITSTDEMPQKIALLYDNRPSSKLAIETYISPFPEYAKLPTELLSINPNQEEMNLKYDSILKKSFNRIFQTLRYKLKKVTKKMYLKIFWIN